jgi:magnesium transporter
MPVVAANLYRAGKNVGPVTIEEPVHCSKDASEFVWIGLVDPTMEELQTLQKIYGLHPLAVEDAYGSKQLPKVDVYGNQLFVLARTARLEGDIIAYGETAIFVGPTHIITVRHGSNRAHSELRTRLETMPELLRNGVDYVLHAILDFIADGYLPIIESIEDAVLKMESHALDHFLGRNDVMRLFTLRRQLMKFQRVIGPMSEVCNKLVHIASPCIDNEVRPYFQDVLDHVKRVEAMVNGLREVLNSVFEASLLLEQERQGTITRQLAAWAAILAVPTAIAGIYGMNFQNMPELKTEYGYYVVIGVIVVLCVGLYVRFKRSGWL